MQTDGAVDCFGAQVESFGVGTKVRLPGNSADTPNIYGTVPIPQSASAVMLVEAPEVLVTIVRVQR